MHALFKRHLACFHLLSDLPEHSLVKLPALSPTMELGTIVQWEKAEGDMLEEGDIIAMIETDKATMDMETPTAGYLAKIMVPAGSKDIALGTVSIFLLFLPLQCLITGQGERGDVPTNQISHLPPT